MSSNATTTREALPAVEQDRAQHAPYVRKSSGLVRDVPFLDMFLMNASSSNPVGIAVAYGIFFAMASFPRDNLLLAIVIALGLGIFVWMTFALVSATLPRVGGDYLYGSRLLHPIIGMGSNLATYAGSVLASGTAAFFVPSVAVGPALTIIGVVTGNKWWVTAGTNVSSGAPAFGIAGGTLLVLAILSLTGTKKIVRVMVWLYGIAFVAFGVSLLILLFKTRAGFIHDVNSFSRSITGKGNAYQATIAAGAKGGLAPGGGYSFKNTMGAVFVVLGYTMFAFWSSTYMAGEMKGSGRRARQLGAMVGGGLFGGILVLVSAAIYLHTAGYDFVAASSNGYYPVGVTPFLHFFASIAAGGSTVLAIVLGVAFIGWFPVALYAGALNMVQRAPFAWAFDGLIPAKVAAVDRRTNTPIVSILLAFVLTLAAAAWACWSKSIFSLISTFTLLLFVPVIVTGVAAVVMPWFRPEIYRGSPSDWRIAGIPVIVVAGLATVAVGILAFVLVGSFASNLGIKHVALTLVLPLIGFAIAAVYYYTARAALRRRGVELDLVYRTIPPA
jgi:basic amino acid/polyamine antiporter, APA family